MTSSQGTLSPDHRRQLGEILWSYGDRLRRVEALLEAQLAFAATGRDAHLGVLATMLDETATRLGELDIEREMLLAPYGTGDGATPALSDLAALGDEGWATVIAEHQRALTASVQRIQYLVDQNRHSMESTLQLLRQLTNNLVDSSHTGYDKAGQTVRSSTPAVLIDRQI